MVTTAAVTATDATRATAPKPAAGEKRKPRRPAHYRVQRGETLTGIAQKFQCDTGDLAKTNKIKGPRFAIRPGQTLKLDGCGG